MAITSLQNPLVKSLVRLRSGAQERRREGVMLVEGFAEIELALSAGHRARLILTCPALTRRAFTHVDAEQIEVSRAVFEKLSVRDRPDGWLAVFELPHFGLQSLVLSNIPLIIAMEAVEKPGNLGAILRTADAAAVDGVVVCDRRADLFSPNVVRASRGTLFSVPVAEATSEEALRFFRSHGLKTLAATPTATVDYTRIDLRGPLAIVVGTEDRGLSDAWLRGADLTARIPMRGRINSLNVSTAAALLVYEVLRQRGT